MLVKLTGWPRIGFLKEIFPNARFIHIYRDGRAVVNSLLNVTWWSGWRGPDNWRWGRLTATQEAKWQRHNQSFVALAAIEWERLMEAFDAARQELEADDLLELGYEAMCQAPVDVFKQAADFCDLPWTTQLEHVVQKRRFKNSNVKWREQLTDSQISILNACLDGVLQRYGYTI
jgi:hypothetical protein